MLINLGALFKSQQLSHIGSFLVQYLVSLLHFVSHLQSLPNWYSSLVAHNLHSFEESGHLVDGISLNLGFSDTSS